MNRYNFILAYSLLMVIHVVKHIVFLGAGQFQANNDSPGYWELGRLVFQGDIFLMSSEAYHRTNGYPIFLSFFIGIFGQYSLLLLCITQHLLALFTDVICSRIAYLITKSSEVSLAALLLTFVISRNCSLASNVLTETLSNFTVMLTIWWFIEKRDYFNAVTTGILAFLAVSAFLVRPSNIVLVLSLLFWLLAITLVKSNNNRMQHTYRFGLFLFFIALLTSPWLISMKLKTNRFTPVVFVGRELWVTAFAPNPCTELALPQTNNVEVIRNLITEGVLPNDSWRNNWSVSGALSSKGMGQVEIDDLMKGVALTALSTSPKKSLLMLAKRVASLPQSATPIISPFGRQYEHKWNDPYGVQLSIENQVCNHFSILLQYISIDHYFITLRIFVLVVVLFLGFAFVRSQLPQELCFLSLIVFGYCSIYAMLEFPHERYRTCIDHFLIILMSCGCWFCVNGHSKKQ